MTEQRLRLGARRAWAGLTAIVVVLGAVEALVVHLIAARLVPQAAPWIDVMLGLLTVVVCLAVASPLWSAHEIGTDFVSLRFGWLARAEVPLADIVSVEIVSSGAELGIAHEARELRMISSTEADAVALDLAAPVQAWFQGTRRVETSRIVVGAADVRALSEAVVSRPR